MKVAFPLTRDQLAAVEVILGKYLDDPDCADWLAEEYGHGFVADADAARGVLKSMATTDPCGTCDGAGCPVCRPTHTRRRSPRPVGCEECPGCPDCLCVGKDDCLLPEYHDRGCITAGSFAVSSEALHGTIEWMQKQKLDDEGCHLLAKLCGARDR